MPNQKKTKRAAESASSAGVVSTVVSTPESTPGPTAKQSASSRPRWHTQAGLALAFVLVGAAGIAIGRASGRPSPSLAPAEPTSASATPAPPAILSAKPPQVFDLAEDSRYKAGIPLREMDREILERVQAGKYERPEMADLFPDRPYKVRLIGSAAERQIGGVMIDFGRDGSVDEKWLLTEHEVTRDVSEDPSAQKRAVHYTLAHGRWQVH